MAQVYDEKLGKPDDAIAAYREVLALDPTSQVALTALDGFFTRRGLWSELAENLETQLGLAETDDAQRDLMLRLAALRETQMGQPEAAIEGYRQVLERDPTNQAALGALERLVGRQRALAGHRRDPRAAVPRAGRLPEADRRARSAGRAGRRSPRARSSSCTRSRRCTRTPRAT